MQRIRREIRPVTAAIAIAIILAGLLLIALIVSLRGPGGVSAVAGIAPVAGAGGQEAARVGGEPIYVYDITREAAAQGRTSSGAPLAPGDEAYETILQELIDQKLLAQEAERRGLARSPEARRRLETARERILGNILLENVVGGTVTDAAIRRMYDEQVRLVEMGDEVRVSHLLVASREEAEAARERILAGEDFAQVAFEVSQDEATRLEGGDLGYVTQDTLTPSLAIAAYATPVGDISAPVESELGWHIVKVEDRRASPRPGFEELRPRIVRFMTFDTIQQLLASLREEADIEVMTPEAAPVSADDPITEFLNPAPSNPAVSQEAPQSPFQAMPDAQ